MKQIEWRVRMACAERGIWSATELQRLVDRRTGVRLSPQTLQAWFRDRPVRIEVRTLTAILNALGCTLTEMIRFDPPRTTEESRATPEEAAHYKQKALTSSAKPRKGRRPGKRDPSQPDVDRMVAALADGADPVSAGHLRTRPPASPPTAEHKKKGS